MVNKTMVCGEECEWVQMYDMYIVDIHHRGTSVDMGEVCMTFALVNKVKRVQCGVGDGSINRCTMKCLGRCM